MEQSFVSDSSVTSFDRETEKKWCRAGDWSSCVVTGSDGWYEDTSVAVTDDRIGSFAVTLKKLQMKDTGWYWCSVGQHKLSVHLQVTPPTTRKFQYSNWKTHQQMSRLFEFSLLLWVSVIFYFSAFGTLEEAKAA